jgi:hypothetical protein
MGRWGGDKGLKWGCRGIGCWEGNGDGDWQWNWEGCNGGINAGAPANAAWKLLLVGKIGGVGRAGAIKGTGGGFVGIAGGGCGACVDTAA